MGTQARRPRAIHHLLLLLVCCASPALGKTPGHVQSFDDGQVDSPPSGFELGRTGPGRDGRWVVLAAPDAPSGKNVLAQVDTDDTDGRFAVAVLKEPALKDLQLSVRCKPVAGKVDQACGLVLRYKDPDNYYLIRANALEGNVRIYFVKQGHRRQLGSWSGKVATGQWHTLGGAARGEQLSVSFEGKKIIEVRDSTFAEAGKVGLWTKADSVTYFDDLEVTAD